jgi:hypothetical protein
MQVEANSSSRKVGKVVTNFPVAGKALKRDLRRVWRKGEDEIQQFGLRAYGILSIS